MSHEETAGTPCTAHAASPLEGSETPYRRSWFAGSARRASCVRKSIRLSCCYVLIGCSSADQPEEAGAVSAAPGGPVS
ncbi:hypothetical protein EYF80_049379 [Liparis tanakae]|uniref:Uncharacterized protein n=1 Tax=Liparis tanakae TaxID=230148 RepID=A0A4Z2FGV7_9TELE|nr:hypothetical protein EYF80_049379 [Liparis tanakae]